MNYSGKRMRIALVLFTFVTGAWTCAAQSQPQKDLPIVTSANVPFYPRVAQAAHIEGVVQLRITTDGKQASSVDIESGPVMLGRAAQENVKTWRFEQHTPTTFESTFHYVLLPTQCDSKCNCDDGGNGTVELNLPSRVEVRAKTVMICDPSEPIERKR
jgi:TonB family protein